MEFKAIIEARKRIAEAAEKAEIVTISHFHFDHHTPSFEDWLSKFFAGPENSVLGWILMTVINCKNEKFLFAPDIQGPMSTKTIRIIYGEKTQMIMIGGPPLYLA